MPSSGFTLAGRVVRRAESAASSGRCAPSREAVVQLDARLAGLARGQGRSRLELGELLEALARRGGHHELGFSSFEAYARERCGRSGRWAVESRTVGRRLGKLPALRAALDSGALGWCKTALLARHAIPETEAELATQALGSTVRELTSRFAEGSRQMSACRNTVDEQGEKLHEQTLHEEKVTLELTMSQKDAWLFAWTRRFVEHAEPGLDTDGTVSALLAEALSTLCWELPAGDLAWCEQVGEGADAAREAAWRAQLDAWRAEAERRCEANFAERGPGGGEIAPLSVPERLDALALDALALDALIVARSAELAAREVELARAALELHEADGARRLGYATEAQYARERLGMSHSSFRAALALARRWPERVRRALAEREIGHVAALLISRVATARTADAWVARARERTAKHLGEDVRAAELLRDTGGSAAPPSEETVQKLHELEGRLLAGDREAVLADGLNARSKTVRIRLRVTRDTARFFRRLEASVTKHLPPKTSFVALLCDYFWNAWKHLGQRREKFAGVYARDRYTCSCPVCERQRGMTPHHVTYRSQGGGDEDENVTTLCDWCHLWGVHENRIKVRGKAGQLEWEIGPLRVKGRKRVA